MFALLTFGYASTLRLGSQDQAAFAVPYDFRLQLGPELIRPQAVFVRVLPPVDSRPFGLDDRRLREAVRAQMSGALAELRAEIATLDTPGLASPAAHASSRATPAKAGDPRSA